MRLLEEANKLPREKLLLKAPAALACAYAMAALRETEEAKKSPVLSAFTETLITLFEAELSRRGV